MTLLEKAKTIQPRTSKSQDDEMTRQQAELVIAYLSGTITAGQAAAGGLKNIQQTTAVILRRALRRGILIMELTERVVTA